MEKREIKKLGVLFLFILAIAIYMDATDSTLLADGTISRDEVGGDVRDVSLILDAEGVLEDYAYEVEIEPQKVTEQQAADYFAKVTEIIADEFDGEWEEVPMEEGYLDGIVEAEWIFSPSGYISSDGTILAEEIAQEGVLIDAAVTMKCGEYEQIYAFPFRLYPKAQSKEEALKKALEKWFVEQQALEGSAYIALPTEILGVSLDWAEKKEYLSLKIIFVELAAVISILFSRKKKRELDEAEKRREAELEYSEIVGQLLVLIETGMTTRQAWARIGKQYAMKKERRLVKEGYVYEAILHMIRRFQEGENERCVYQNFLKEVDVLCYRRLMRILLNTLEKGNKDVCSRLKEEAHQAYDQRILLAKKLGEETSTKMLLPLMLMMILVMGIVMIPAIISFSL